MKVIQERGSYVLVPPSFLVVTWASTDMALLHGEPDHLFEYRRDLWVEMKEKIGKDIKKSTRVGDLMPFVFKDEEVKRKGVLLFNRIHHHEHSRAETNAALLLKLSKLVNNPKAGIKRISMHVPFGVAAEELTQLVWNTPFKEETGVLIRTT